MVMILQLGIKSFHQHHYAENVTITCDDCDHHKVHSGHLLSWNGESNDCVVCHILSTPFTECQPFVLTFQSPTYHCKHYCADYNIINGCRGTNHLRGPPASLL